MEKSYRADQWLVGFVAESLSSMLISSLESLESCACLVLGCMSFFNIVASGMQLNLQVVARCT